MELKEELPDPVTAMGAGGFVDLRRMDAQPDERRRRASEPECSGGRASHRIMVTESSGCGWRPIVLFGQRIVGSATPPRDDFVSGSAKGRLDSAAKAEGLVTRSQGDLSP